MYPAVIGCNVVYTDMFIKLSLFIVSFKILQALLDFRPLVLSIIERHALNRERFQTGKGVRQGCILSPCLFKLYAKYIMKNTGLKHKQESRLPGEISVTSDMQTPLPLWQKAKKN